MFRNQTNSHSESTHQIRKKGGKLPVISEKVIPHPSVPVVTGSGGGGSTVDYCQADILQSTDYSPFGVQLSGRNLKLSGNNKNSPITIKRKVFGLHIPGFSKSRPGTDDLRLGGASGRTREKWWGLKKNSEIQKFGLMKFILIILMCSPYIYCKAQVVNINKDRLLISDTTCFYNRDYYLVESITAKRNIDISKFRNDSTFNILTGIKINSFFLEQLYTNQKIAVRLSNDSASIYPSWSLFVDMNHELESYTLIPVFCDNDFLVVNVIGVQKVRGNKIRRGYLRTLVYKM